MKRGVILATAGLLMALVVIGLLGLGGYCDLDPMSWVGAVLVTAIVQSSVWFVLHSRLQGERGLDRHFIFTPLVAAGFLFCLDMYIAPEVRGLLLMGWLAAPVFVAGLAGFLGAISLSLLMAMGYLLVVFLLRTHGRLQGPPDQDLLTASVFLLLNFYSGVVYERLKRDRAEMKRLRRELAGQAMQDALTGLPNRRYFESVLGSELNRIRRHGGICTLAAIDVDNFKRFNDTHGHPAGDRLLRNLSSAISSRMRISDVLARIGGDEFLVLMVNASEAEAGAAMERLRAAIASRPFAVEEGGAARQTVTVSIGVAASAADGGDAESLVRDADAALYEAKRAGKNRVETALGLV